MRAQIIEEITTVEVMVDAKDDHTPVVFFANGRKIAFLRHEVPRLELVQHRGPVVVNFLGSTWVFSEALYSAFVTQYHRLLAAEGVPAIQAAS